MLKGIATSSQKGSRPKSEQENSESSHSIRIPHSQAVPVKDRPSCLVRPSRARLALEMHSFQDILQKLRERYPALNSRIEEAEALSRWANAVGPAIAKHSRATLVRDKVLWIEVTHPIWRSELHYRKRQILENLNRGAKEVIVDLFLIDPRNRTSPEAQRERDQKTKAAPTRATATRAADTQEKPTEVESTLTSPSTVEAESFLSGITDGLASPVELGPEGAV